MNLSELQAKLLNHLMAVGCGTTKEIADACSVRVDQVAASLNSLCTQGSKVPIRQHRERKSSQYTTWYYTNQASKEASMNIDITVLQDRLLANIIALNHGEARSDVLARACNTGPETVAASLLLLRTHGIVGSANDGGRYNFWFLTAKGREFLDERTARIRREEQARRQDALEAESEARIAATKERLLQAQRDRKARAAQRAERQSTLPTVCAALDQAMNDKGFPPIENPKYIVWCPTSQLPPKVQYATKDEAINVAGIMAQRFPKQVFIVCELQTVVLYTPPVQQPGQIVRGTL